MIAEWYEEAGELSVIPVDEEKIEEEDRIPRVTSATWWVLGGRLGAGSPAHKAHMSSDLPICRKYETGAVGSLTHALILQGTKYSTELEICECRRRDVHERAT
jgi:hypothetical protein